MQIEASAAAFMAQVVSAAKPETQQNQLAVAPDPTSEADSRSVIDGTNTTSAEDPNTDSADKGVQPDPLNLTPEEKIQVRELQQRDREVRAHEQAHVAVGGRYVTRPASYDYATGPDGRQYAVGGEVSIDTSMPADPVEAIEKARTVQRAALAPSDPSTQDYQVAAQARQMEATAQRELAREEREAATEQLQVVVNARSEAIDGSEVIPDLRTDLRLNLATEAALAPTSTLHLVA